MGKVTTELQKSIANV